MAWHLSPWHLSSLALVPLAFVLPGTCPPGTCPPGHVLACSLALVPLALVPLALVRSPKNVILWSSNRHLGTFLVTKTSNYEVLFVVHDPTLCPKGTQTPPK